MGMFDYECACGGATCPYEGGQHGGDSYVVIEVPLRDGTTVYMKGHYDAYGRVEVGNCTFYAEQFSEGFEYCLEDHDKEAQKRCFLAKRIWTSSYYDCNDEDECDGTLEKKITNCYPKDITVIVKPGNDTISKCMRIDEYKY